MYEDITYTICPLAKPIVLCPERALLAYSEIPISDEKTHHYDAPERKNGAWEYEWGNDFAAE